MYDSELMVINRMGEVGPLRVLNPSLSPSSIVVTECHISTVTVDKGKQDISFPIFTKSV